MSQQGLRIIVGLDFSESGDIALEHALLLAAGMPNAEIHVVHVATGDDFSSASGPRLERYDTVLRALPPKVWRRVDRIGKGENALPDMLVSVHVRFGWPAAAIHQVAVDYDGDLIVVGTHARRGVKRLVLGSVAQELVRIARVPVTVARAKNFADLPRSDMVEPPHPPGEPLPTERHEPHLYASTRLMSWTRLAADIEGIQLSRG